MTGLVPTRGVETVHEEMLARAAKLIDQLPLTTDVVDWLDDYRVWVLDGAAGEHDEYVWLPENDPNWRVLSAPTSLYTCRGSRSCHLAPVVKIDRSADPDRPRWWYYCERHAFGRRIRDGVLEHRVLRPKGEAR